MTVSTDLSRVSPTRLFTEFTQFLELLPNSFLGRSVFPGALHRPCKARGTCAGRNGQAGRREGTSSCLGERPCYFKVLLEQQQKPKGSALSRSCAFNSWGVLLPPERHVLYDTMERRSVRYDTDTTAWLAAGRALRNHF